MLTLLAVGAAAFLFGRQTADDSASGNRATPPPSAPTSTATPRSSTTAKDSTTTSVTPTSTSTSDPEAAPDTNTGATEAGAARSAAVVYFTYGTPASGYPPLQGIVAPEGLPATDSMVIGSDYRNAGCTQIVQSITETNSAKAYFEFDLVLALRCPDGPPTSTADGTTLPLTINEHIDVTTAADPAGGFWATQVQLIDQD